MAYVVYEKSSTLIMGPYTARREVMPNYRQSYKTMAAAKAALTRWTKWWMEDMSHGDAPENNPTYRYAIAEADYFFANIEKKRERTVMGTENTYMEGVNTPAHMSPASETYWSM